MKAVEKKQPNKLIKEKSPYLLQHAYNPVNWYPWCSEAFEVAKNENKPVFLSIGYSTCHWCHVMEHESFEDNDVARLMNEYFVSIKVDREERPDIDNLYMTVCQMLTGSGGWPLTIIMTPDKKPFFAGTYFPKETKYGRVGMIDLITKIKEIWMFKQEEALTSADQIIELVKQSTVNITSNELLNENILESAFHQLCSQFDETFGGFGSAPKFPMPHYLLFLLRYWKRKNDSKALLMVEKTLQRMWLGGIYDHIGFGFHRYSTDSRWLLPHFEKMLYDQALLSMAYLETYQVTKNKVYEKITKEIFAFVICEMVTIEGGFISAYDADSEGKEGKYYTWSCSELRKLLNKEEMDFISEVFNLKEDGNYFDKSNRNKTGQNIFYMQKLPFEIASDMALSSGEFCEKMDKIRQKIFMTRKKRIYLPKDDKILTNWNGLMIAALAKGSQVLSDSSYTSFAQRAACFILDKLIVDGRLMHSYRDGESKVFANLDDYAFLIWGLLELYETVFSEEYLETSLKLSEYVIDHFWDSKNNGFFFTADDVESLFVRQKDIYDGAIPSSNAVMILNLLKLFNITGNNKFKELAENVVKVFSAKIKEVPVAYAQFLCSLDYLLGPSSEVVIVGDYNDDTTQLMLNSLYKEFMPSKILLLKPRSETTKITHIAPYTKDLLSVDNKATAYVCKNNVCSMPVTDVKELMDLLGGYKII